MLELPVGAGNKTVFAFFGEWVNYFLLHDPEHGRERVTFYKLFE